MIVSKSKRRDYTGSKNPCWRGGRIKSSYGYILILKPEHPLSSKDGYVREHRLVVENFIGRILSRKELVHHINGDKSDNRIENLQILSHSEHLKLHKSEGIMRGKDWTGIKMSEETRKKMSESQKAKWIIRKKLNK